jgi:hypothetical protein
MTHPPSWRQIRRLRLHIYLPSRKEAGTKRTVEGEASPHPALSRHPLTQMINDNDKLANAASAHFEKQQHQRATRAGLPPLEELVDWPPRTYCRASGR